MLGDNSSEYAVEFNNVYLKYKDAGEDALSNIDFKVKSRETVGIIDSTDCGTPPLINLIQR